MRIAFPPRRGERIKSDLPRIRPAGVSNLFWQNWVVFMPVVTLALGCFLFLAASSPIPVFSSAPFHSVGPHEKNARQRNSRRRVARRTRRRSEAIRPIDRDF